MGNRDFSIWEVYLNRLVAVLVCSMFVVAAIVGMVSAIKPTQFPAIKEMLLFFSSILWVCIAIMGWHGRKEKPLWLVIGLILLAIISIAGMFLPVFHTFALWMHFVMMVLFTVAIIMVFPQMWGSSIRK